MQNTINLTEVEWYKKTKKLAIADVMYSYNFGTVSHQPNGLLFAEGIFPMRTAQQMRSDGDSYYAVYASDLFLPTKEQIEEYWSEVAGINLKLFRLLG